MSLSAVLGAAAFGAGVSNGLRVHNVDTGLSYATIQEAVSAPQTADGQTIIVDPGVYYGNVFVNKSISLIGAGRGVTFLDGNSSATGSGVIIWQAAVNLTGFTILNDGNFSSVGVYLHGLGSSRVYDNEVSGFSFAFWLLSSKFNTVASNVVSNSSLGVVVENFLDLNNEYNVIANNTVTGANMSGIEVLGNSSYNTFSGNVLTGNAEGFRLDAASQYNTFEWNNVTANRVGVFVADPASSNNTFFENRFMNNTIQVQTNGSANLWDDGARGNYWSDYFARYPNATEIDKTGIGNTPYVIDSNNVDYYPIIDQTIISEFPSVLIAVSLLAVVTLLEAAIYKNSTLKERKLGSARLPRP